MADESPPGAPARRSRPPHRERSARRERPTHAETLTRRERRTRREHRRRASARVRRNRFVALLVALGLLVVLVVVVPGAWFVWQLDPPGGPGDGVSVRIEDGWGVREIGDALADEGVVGSSLAFQVYAGVTRRGPFQAGEYDLRSGLGVRGAARELEAGPDVVFEELAVPPGLRLTEIADRVGELPGRSSESFLQLATSGTIRSRYQPGEVRSLEGLLYPDTYVVADHEDEADILRQMVDRFDEVADQVGLEAGAAGVGLTPYEAIVVASLIESEAGVPEDRVRISRVVFNRLADGTPLQIDATVLYAIGERRLQTTPEERAVDSPYNTYVIRGLPPTPISSVTDASLLAAIAPADGPWRYYVLIDGDGRHAFAETFAEHLANVAVAEERGLLE